MTFFMTPGTPKASGINLFIYLCTQGSQERAYSGQKGCALFLVAQVSGLWDRDNLRIGDLGGIGLCDL